MTLARSQNLKITKLLRGPILNTCRKILWPKPNNCRSRFLKFSLPEGPVLTKTKTKILCKNWQWKVSRNSQWIFFENFCGDHHREPVKCLATKTFWNILLPYGTMLRKRENNFKIQTPQNFETKRWSGEMADSYLSTHFCVNSIDVFRGNAF